jgi:hypothetical protein
MKTLSVPPDGQCQQPNRWAEMCNAAIHVTGEHRGAVLMVIIDSQVYAYEANTPQRLWHSVPNWPDHVTGDEMVAAMESREMLGLRPLQASPHL